MPLAVIWKQGSQFWSPGIFLYAFLVGVITWLVVWLSLSLVRDVNEEERPFAPRNIDAILGISLVVFIVIIFLVIMYKICYRNFTAQQDTFLIQTMPPGMEPQSPYPGSSNTPVSPGFVLTSPQQGSPSVSSDWR